MVKNLYAMQDTTVRSLGWKDPLENGIPIFLPGESQGWRSWWAAIYIRDRDLLNTDEPTTILGGNSSVDAKRTLEMHHAAASGRQSFRFLCCHFQAKYFKAIERLGRAGSPNNPSVLSPAVCHGLK